MWWIWLACSSSPVPCDPPGTQVIDARAAGCVVVWEDRLLLVKGSSGWSIPGGHREPGEDPSQTAARETLEEAGVAVVAHEPFCAASNGFVAYRCAPTGSVHPVPDGRETDDARFMTVDAVRAMPDDAWRFPAQRAAYLRALQ